VYSNRQQLLGSLPLQVGADGKARGTTVGFGAKSVVDLTSRYGSGVSAVAAATDLRREAMPVRRLPRPADGPGLMADVMTFGATAASALPPKKRPQIDGRLLDQLLNGVVVEPPPRVRDVRVGNIASHWEPTANPGATGRELMEQANAPSKPRQPVDIKYTGVFG
jgi:hypothetical protein